MTKNEHKSYASVLVICGALLIISLAYNSSIASAVCLAITSFALLSAKIANLIHSAWMKLAELLAMIIQPIVMGAFYFLFFTPFAIVGRLFSKKDLLQLKSNGKTTFVARNTTYQKTDFEKIW